MRKLILFNMVTVDNFFAGPNGEIDWHNVDAEFNDFAIQQLDECGGLIFGRTTYQMMASYWPTPAGIADDPEVANRMNELPKFVVSRTLARADWNNTRLIKEDAAGEIARLKQQPGKDLYLFGSAVLASGLIQNGLIDEYRLMVNPVILGGGKAMFQNVQAPLKLKLLKAQPFRSGNVLLYYQTA